MEILEWRTTITKMKPLLKKLKTELRWQKKRNTRLNRSIKIGQFEEKEKKDFKNEDSFMHL